MFLTHGQETKLTQCSIYEVFMKFIYEIVWEAGSLSVLGQSSGAVCMESVSSDLD